MQMPGPCQEPVTPRHDVETASGNLTKEPEQAECQGSESQSRGFQSGHSHSLQLVSFFHWPWHRRLELEAISTGPLGPKWTGEQQVSVLMVP